MKLFETYLAEGIGYEKLFSFKSWRIARLNYIEELDIEHLNFIECHLETDEVFVLLNGECHMFLTTDINQKNFEYFAMEPFKVYRIPKGVYHAHALSKDAQLLIIEEEDTCDGNSHRIYLNEEEMNTIKKLALGASK
ncbi:hypothetical protein BK011_06420 [Tenericutes bacterium MZ-XQ]|nr:hypothetical protein BK011_06420 [Tenericutes bacterium MZ-XQ]